MKHPTLLAPTYLHESWYRNQLAQRETNIVTHCSAMPLSALKNELVEEPSFPLHDTLEGFLRIQKAGQTCQIYKKMLDYPDFSLQLIEFYQLMQTYHIALAELPQADKAQEELKLLLSSLEGLAFESNRDSLFYHRLQSESWQGTVLFPGFIADLSQQRLWDCVEQHGGERIALSSSIPKSKQFFKALNSRLEAESLAQYIINENLEPEEVMVILCDSTRDLPIIESVFSRYQLPFSAVSNKQPSRIMQAWIALAHFVKTPNLDTWKETVVQQAYPILLSPDFFHYVERFIFSISQLQAPFQHVEHALKQNTLFSTVEKENLLRLEKQAGLSQIQLIPYLHSLLEPTTLSQRLHATYELLRIHPLVHHPKEAQIVNQIKLQLEECWDLLEQDGTLECLLSLQKGQTIEESDSITKVIAITDCKHPLPCRKTSVLFGASQNCYPGNQSYSGLFDEEYLAKTSMPSQAKRYQHYMTQLDWIDKSASERLIYSYSLGSYEGKAWDVAFEIEQKAAQKALIWPCIQVTPQLHHVHQLPCKLATQLFFANHELRGSVSSFETYFQCPYAYFLKTGLHLSKSEIPSVDTAIIGTIQHALLEQLISSKGKHYGKSESVELHSILEPYFQQLESLFPQQGQLLEVIQKRMITNFQLTLAYLDEMESNTSFKPVQQEYHFDVKLLEEDSYPIHLKGIIDRIDQVQNDIRIIDYKSSSKTLSESKVRAGLQLQLLTYLMIVSNQLQANPIGAYYYTLKNETLPVSEAALNMTKGEIIELDQNDWMKSWYKSQQLQGWTMQSHDGLDYDGNHVQSLSLKEGKVTLKPFDYPSIELLLLQVLGQLRTALLQGNIPLDPVEGACLFCDYKSICRNKKAPRKPSEVVDFPRKLKKGE